LCSFEKLSQNVIDRISENKRTLSFARGETIFGLGDQAGHFYCVRTGRVQIYRSSPYREQSFKIASTGDWVGHRDALYGGGYQHGARCLTDVTVCKFSRSVLEECLATNPDFSRAIVADLASGWVDSENQSYNLGSRKIMERLADYLLTLKAQLSPETDHNGAHVSQADFGGRERELAPQNEVQMDFFLTREMLATLLGTTTESVIRTLSDFKARGWIDLNRSKVTLTNEKELARLVAES
jgi:CRP/FNR family transcriptional regulator